MEDDSARMFTCGNCHELAVVCLPCDRRKRYCSRQCTQIARRKSVRSAGRRYQKTTQGANRHAIRQAAYIERRKLTHHSVPAERSNADAEAPTILISNRRVMLKPDSAGQVRCCKCRELCGPWLRRDKRRRRRRCRVENDGGKT